MTSNRRREIESEIREEFDQSLWEFMGECAQMGMSLEASAKMVGIQGSTLAAWQRRDGAVINWPGTHECKGWQDYLKDIRTPGSPLFITQMEGCRRAIATRIEKEKRERGVVIDGVLNTRTGHARARGLTMSTVIYRMQRMGMTFELALKAPRIPRDERARIARRRIRERMSVNAL